ncbi:hypothetical protein DFR29_105172 [Tahibacter aquaticus]|uniref:Uncharacterized protein n=1 Tax=Tahibacter aquaticus TaxID=520092 RepID=A0A4R6Z0T9_9GAMM|nr:YbhN family protein [Tahibacter aquaticus]TDR44989.1 hypothetical protein DFR29_105172 [Tahibacter aquaticus]
MAAIDSAAAPPRPGWQRWGLRLLWLAFAALTAWLLWNIAHETDWNAVREALQRRSWRSIALIAGVALTSYAVYGLLDVIGAASLGLALPRWRVWLIAMTSYACNLNLGSLVGAAAMRYRLYGQHGVAVADVSRLIALSMASNWMGFLLLLTSMPLWGSERALARWTGAGLAWAISLAAIAVLALYFRACFARKTWRLRGHVFRFPPWPVAAAQVGVAASNWALMGALLNLALGDQAGYAESLGSLLVAAVAGAATHVPGGWGVLDYVLVKSLAGGDPHRLVAGVLVYRAAYYLLPLSLAGAGLLLMGRWRKVD